MSKNSRRLSLAACLGLVLAAGVAITAPASQHAPTAEPPIVKEALSSMNVFDRAQRAKDRDVAAAVAADIDAVVSAVGAPSSDAEPGSANTASVRSLLERVGSKKRTIYAFKTSKGRVCGGLSGVTAGCFEGFTKGGPVNWTVGRAPGEPVVIFGFVPDGIESVRVIAEGASLAADLGENAFYAELQSAASGVETLKAIVVTYKSGVEQRLPLSLGR